MGGSVGYAEFDTDSPDPHMVPANTLPFPVRRFAGERWALELIIEPGNEPMTLAEMKAALREFDSATGNDTQIEDAFIAAREWAENFTGRAIIDQTWRLTVDNQAGSVSSDDSLLVLNGATAEIMLRRSPILEITSFKTYDATGTGTEVSSDTYAICEAASRWPRIARIDGSQWDSCMFKIEFRAGFIDQSEDPEVGTIPRRFLQAIKLYAEALYDRDTEKMPALMKAAENLLKPANTQLGMA